MLLAQECPELVELSIAEYPDEGSLPSGSGISDSIIDAVAQKLVKISELSLVFNRPELLSWQSVLCLGRYCKNLTRLKLSCNFTWQEATSGAQENIFSKLWGLEVVLDESNREMR